MRNRVVVLAAVALIASAMGAAAQKTTEIYIPIGMSPGTSGTYSVIGEIVAYDEAMRTLTIRNEAGDHTAEISGETLVWLDRSRSGERNAVGSPAALEPGRRCEIKHVYEGEVRRAEAEWVKVEPSPVP